MPPPTPTMYWENVTCLHARTETLCLFIWVKCEEFWLPVCDGSAYSKTVYNKTPAQTYRPNACYSWIFPPGSTVIWYIRNSQWVLFGILSSSNLASPDYKRLLSFHFQQSGTVSCFMIYRQSSHREKANKLRVNISVKIIYEAILIQNLRWFVVVPKREQWLLTLNCIEFVFSLGEHWARIPDVLWMV